MQIAQKKWGLILTPLPPILKGLFNTFPEVTINYNYDPTETILDKISRYELDCAILSEVPSNPKLDIYPFFKDELINRDNEF